MTNYTLQPNESVLYQGNVSIEKRPGSVELILTNLNLAFIITIKKFLSKSQVEVETYPVEEIKFYNDVPQIKQKNAQVEIFLTGNEIIAVFESKSEATKFVNAAMYLLTGKTAAERGADKFKDAVGLVDNALGINTVGAVKNVLENGVVGSLLGGMGKKSSLASKTTAAQEVVEVAKDLLGNKSQPETSHSNSAPATPTDEQLEALKKLKELVEMGVITQEEFDTKKKQLLGL